MSLPYRTKHSGLAAFLKFVLGDESHVSTTVDTATSYAFEPYAEAAKLADQFFAPGSVGVSDARALLECGRALKHTANAARNSADGLWVRGDST